MKMERESLTRRLTGCLLTEEEYAGGTACWETLDDPFPLWGG